MTERKSNLKRALDRGLVDLVGINECKFLAFNRPVPGQPASLGVRGLSACSVVIIVSRLGAIVSHIGPNILGSQDSNSFVQLAKSKMDEVERLYNLRSEYFPSNGNAYIVYATFQGVATSPEQAAIFRERLTKLNLPIVDRAYERSTQSLIDENRPEGTVWVVKPKNNPPTVYLEDKMITPRGDAGTQVATQAFSSQASSSQAYSPQASSSQASSLQASFSRPTSRSVTNPSAVFDNVSRQASMLPRSDSSWMRRQGDNTYKLVNPTGAVLQETQDIPQNVWIHLYAPDGNYQSAAMWNGSGWRYAGGQS